MKPISQWRYASIERKDGLLARYNELTEQDAIQMGMTLQTLKRRLREYRATPRPATIPHELRAIIRDMLQPQTTTHYRSHPAPKPTPPATDTEQFNTRLRGIKDDYLRVMHLCDIHFPYQDDRALDLAVQLVGYNQPHVCVVGSDEFDFMRFSTFDSDPRQNAHELDDIDLIRLDHQNLIDRLIDQSPQTIFVWIFGNHDYRLYKHILKNSPNVAKTVMREFADVVRYQGRVMWLGETDQIQIDNLVVAHGTRAGQNAAKSHLDMTGGQVNYMAGHVHRRSYWQRVGYHYGVNSVTSGCLCDLQPHYKGYKQDLTGWELGTCLCEIKRGDMQATAHFQNLRFDEDSEGRLSVRYHGVTFLA